VSESPGLTGQTKNKFGRCGMFFVAYLCGAFHHAFTTILHSFTTQNTTFCARNFSKTPEKREITTQKKICTAHKI
jgi:hypothetical protein